MNVTCKAFVADATKLPLDDKSVDMTMTSPPYCDARTYGIGADRECGEWVAWMLDVVTECVRVTKGAVIVVAASVTRKRTYWPACEGLMYEWWKRGGSAYRPVYWHRSGIPGSGGDDWFRADVEYCMCFKDAGKLVWADNVAMGKKCGYPVGGAMSNRTEDGQRRNAKTGSRLHRNGSIGKNGKRKLIGYSAPEMANPGTLFKTGNGGGALGDKRAHLNEAPYPEKLCEFFIRSLCPPGGTVLDPFSGSGTTAKVALRFGRNAITTDIRESQIELTKRRIAEVQKELFVS